MLTSWVLLYADVASAVTAAAAHMLATSSSTATGPARLTQALFMMVVSQHLCLRATGSLQLNTAKQMWISTLQAHNQHQAGLLQLSR
jgi:hypothetical protein